MCKPVYETCTKEIPTRSASRCGKPSHKEDLLHGVQASYETCMKEILHGLQAGMGNLHEGDLYTVCKPV